MKRNDGTRVSCLLVRLFTIAVVGGLCYYATALDLPPVIPEGAGWDTYWNRSSVSTCDCQSVYVYTLDTSACRDFNSTEKLAQKNAFLAAYSGHCSFVGDATYTYNCHGYVFHSSSKWGGNPDNWEGSTSPCYYETAAGSVYRWGGSHSAKAGSGYTYKGKCGREILCNHDNYIYGTHTKRWAKR